jgi:hypothetical protein
VGAGGVGGGEGGGGGGEFAGRGCGQGGGVQEVTLGKEEGVCGQVSCDCCEWEGSAASAVRSPSITVPVDAAVLTVATASKCIFSVVVRGGGGHSA